MGEDTWDRKQSAASPGVSTDLLSLAQAAQALGVSRWTIHGWISHGDLPVVWIGRVRAVDPAALAAVRARIHLDGVVPAWRQDCHRCGRRLRTLREAAGLSQLELAARSGLTHEAMSRWEL